MAGFSALPDGAVLDGIPDGHSLLPDGAKIEPLTPPTHDPAMNAQAQAAIEAALQAGVPPSTFAERVWSSAKDIPAGLGQMLFRGAEAAVGDSSAKPAVAGLRKEFDRFVDQRAQDYEAQRAAAGSTGFDWAKLTGKGAALVPLSAPIAAAAPAISAAAGPFMGAVGTGAASGALGGAAEPVLGAADGSSDFWHQKAVDTGLGAAGGAATGGGLNVAGRVVAPQIPAASRALRDAGVTQTIGQTLGGWPARVESAFESFPVVGDAIKAAKLRNLESYNRVAVNGALGEIGEQLPANIPAGRQALAHAGQQISAAYDDLIPRLTGRVDGQFANDLQAAATTAADLPHAGQQQFAQIIQNRLARRIDPNTGEITGADLRAAQSDIGRLARDYGNSTDGDHRTLGRALQETHDALMEMVERANPEAAGRLADINRAYAMQLRLENAAARAGTAAREGVFTPAQLDASVRQMDTSLRRRAYARGDALLQDYAQAGTQALGNTVPDSGTPFRLMVTDATKWPSLAMFGAGAIPYTRAGQYLGTGAIAGAPQLRAPLGAALQISGPAAAAALGLPASVQIPMLPGR